MRRFILIAAMLLISASARADGLRGLSLAANETVAAEAPNAAETPNAKLPQPGAPKVVEQPSSRDAAPQPAKADQSKPDQARSASGKAEKPKLKRSPLEVRVVDDLHRHGIYW